MRLIDADMILEAMRSKMDMQELYLPIHFKEIVIDDMPTITLKEYAKAEGYKLIKNNPMPKLQSCPICGKRGSIWQSTEGYLVRCNSCDYETPLYKNEHMAREVWNVVKVEPNQTYLVHEEENDSWQTYTDGEGHAD